jgi:hypothetical protein
LAQPPLENDKELALLVGETIRSAFLEDNDFRKTLIGPNKLLERIVSESDNDLIKFGLPSSFNSHIVSSYHAARAIELLHLEILNRFPKSSNFLFMVMHSFALEAVFGLQCARQLFAQIPVIDLLNGRAAKIGEVFDSKFPLLKETRDALAHDDERVFAIVRRVVQGNDFEHMQMVSLQGTKLRCKNENLEDIEFNFPTTHYTDLAKDIESVLAG